MKIIVTSLFSKYHFILNGYAELFNKHWSSDQTVDVVCNCQPKNVNLPNNFVVHNINMSDNTCWSDGLIKYLSQISDEYFLLAMDDHFIFTQIDISIMQTAFALIKQHKFNKVWLTSNPQNTGVRFDNTFNLIRAYTKNEFQAFAKKPVVRPTHSTHQSLMLTALCASIWSKSFFLSLLKPNISARQFEHENLKYVSAQNIALIPQSYIGWIYPQHDVMYEGQGQLFNISRDLYYTHIDYVFDRSFRGINIDGETKKIYQTYAHQINKLH